MHKHSDCGLTGLVDILEAVCVTRFFRGCVSCLCVVQPFANSPPPEQTITLTAMTLKQITPADVASFAYDPVDAAALKDATLIVNDVRDNGEPALHKHAARLGDAPSEDAPLLVDQAALKQAYDALPLDQQQVLQRTTQRIKAFAQAQRASIGNFQQKIDGGFAGQDVRAHLIGFY